MLSPAATFDKSRLLTLYARVQETGVPIILTFVNSAGAPFPINGNNFILKARKRLRSQVLFELTEGSGLEVFGTSLNKLRISLSAANAEVKADTCFWQLIAQAEDHTWLNGPFIFHEGEFDGVSNDSTFTIAEDGSNVTITVNSGEESSLSAASQTQMNTGTATDVYATPATIQDKDDTAVALTDGATIDITGPKHTLSTAVGRAFTISHTGDCIVIDITLSATSATFTFPGAGTLCIFAGTSSGDNTLVVTGATSGDHIMVGIIKYGSNYRVTGVNFGQ